MISDTSWPGYEDVPGWVADGYTTIFEELSEQLPRVPELVAVQIGVGALASAAVRALAAPERALVGVEPDDAACALAAVRAGGAVLVPGPHRSLMVGLSCGLVSQIALPDMARGMRAFCAIDDRAVEARGAPAAGRRPAHAARRARRASRASLALHERWPDDAWERLGAGARPSALAICTEAPTDPASFARITGAAA